MRMVRQRGRFDWLVELGGASAFGLGCTYAAFKLAPSFAVTQQTATIFAGFAFFAAGLAAMRIADGGPASHRLADFAVAAVTDEELLLDRPVELTELLLNTPCEPAQPNDVLLLDDPLPAPDPASRVVQLFASLPMPTPGELKDQIDRHLAEGRTAARPVPDASQALYAALEELRRSLR